MKYDHLAYFESIARKLLAIGHTDQLPHFFRASTIFSLEELITSLNSAQYPALVVFDKTEGRFTDQLSDNLVIQPLYQVMILKPASGMDSVSRKLVMENCFSIFRAILSRMSLDKTADTRLPRSLELTGLRNFNRNDIVYNSIGPIFDNLYGIEFSFSLAEPFDLSFKEEEWDE